MKSNIIPLMIMLLLIPIFLKTNIRALSAEEELNFPSDFPYLFVSPNNIVAEPGKNITVSVCVFNLTQNVFKTNYIWQSPADPYPTYNPNGIHIYPLGSLLGFDVNITWNPDVLEYLNHIVTVPVENYPNPIPPMNYSGTLHTPTVNVTEVVSQEHGYLRLARAHQGTNVFNGNGTIMQITFKVKIEGSTELRISSAKLSSNKWLVPEANKDIIIFRVGHSFVTTPMARTRLYSLNVEVAVGAKRFPPPIINGENASVKVTIKNEGSVVDYYNLTVYHKLPNNTLYVIYNDVNVAIESGEQNMNEIIVLAEDLNIGIHMFIANLTVLHEGEVFSGSINRTVRVISGELTIQYSYEPKVVHVGDEVTFTATGNHSEHDITLNFTWKIYEKENVPPLKILYGTTVSNKFAIAKNWTIVLIATDSLGVTWNPDRPLTSGYKLEFKLEVLERTEAAFPWDIVVFAAIILAVIVLAAVYTIKRRR